MSFVLVFFCCCCCFSSDRQGWVRWYSCLLMIGFVFLFCFLFGWGILHRVLLVAGRCWVLYSSGFLCGSSHYLIIPRISSLVVWGLGVNSLIPKAQGLIPGQEWRFQKWFVMALSENKTNTQKRATKDEPQTNGFYKIGKNN